MMNLAKQTGFLCILMSLMLVACADGDDSSGSSNAATTQDDATDSSDTANSQNDATGPDDTSTPQDDVSEVSPPETAPIELIGSWTNNYDGTETITEDSWDNGYSVLTIASFDNEDNWAVVQSPADDEYTPNQYSKYVWTELDAGVVFYCTVSYGLETQEEAEASEDTSDDSAPLDGGCNGFAWTQLTAN